MILTITHKAARLLATRDALRAMEVYQQRFDEIGAVPVYDSATRQQLDDSEFVDFNLTRS